VLSLTTAMLAFCTPSIASACESAVQMVRPQPSPAQLVASAEKILEVSPNEAARVINANFPLVQTVPAGKDPVWTRALRVLAVATVRVSTNGETLGWAVQALRDIEKVKANDPAVQADLGEALSKTSTGKAEALTILSKLADKDLMGSPHAYAALASLKQAKGDAAGAQAAMSRCREMSKNAANTCKLVVAAKA
jgi:predicted RNA polymerase sigma factor